MATGKFTVRCTKNEQIARNVYELRFTKPEGFSFVPGQFIFFQIPLIDDLENREPRAFSIASAPSENELIFVMKIRESGRCSQWIRDVVEPGTEAHMQGPMGLFTLDRETDKDALLVCTSTGIGPYRSQLLHYLPEESRRTDLIFGVRSEEDLFWVEEFEQLAKKYENFFFHLALSSPSPDWPRHKGRVQTLIPLICPDLSKKKLYACGNPAMVINIRTAALEQWNMAKEDVHVEGYV